MQALMDILYELAGHIKGGNFLITYVTISSPRRTLDLVRHVDEERERERERKRESVFTERSISVTTFNQY